MSETTKQFAENLSELITEKGIQARQLSKDTGISLGTVSNYRNDCAEPGISNAAKLAEYFGVSLDWLAGLEPDCRTPDSNFRGIREYVGLSESALKYLHEIKNTEEATALSMLLESKAFRAFLNKLYAAIIVKADITLQLYELGLSWNVDDIIKGTDTDNAQSLFNMLIKPDVREQDMQYHLYSLSKLYDEIINDLLESMPQAKLNQLSEKVDFLIRKAKYGLF